MVDMVPPRGALDGITVLDLTRVLSGPYCTMLLGDMGARVIKVERPGRGDDTRAWGPPFLDGESTYFLSVNRNKESVTLDFQVPAGRAVLGELIARSDVLVENFRPGTLARHGFDHETLAARHPRLVYVSISGFGQSGPRSAEPGYDAVIQGEAGLMSITGPADGPACRLGVAVADIVSGMFAAQGAVAALLARERTGRGQLVDVALLDSVAALLTYQAGIWFATGDVPRRRGNEHPSISPYDTFESSDGALILAVGTDAQFRACCIVLGIEGLADDPRFRTNADRVANNEALKACLEERFRRQPRAYWIGRLTGAGVPAGAVRGIDEALGDPQLAHRRMIEYADHGTLGSIPQLGLPIKLSSTPGGIRRAPPTLGQHTESVLTELGRSPEDIAALRDAGAI
jgi:crotonobetainyl-CoA:carnitine CoA-transferase CaiB-like acyl-CoA transferase